MVGSTLRDGAARTSTLSTESASHETREKTSTALMSTLRGIVAPPASISGSWSESMRSGGPGGGASRSIARGEPVRSSGSGRCACARHPRKRSLSVASAAAAWCGSGGARQSPGDEMTGTNAEAAAAMARVAARRH